MSSSIGSASLVLTTNATGLASGLASSAKSVKVWADGVQSKIASTFSNLKGHVTGFLGDAKSQFGGAGSTIGAALGGPLGAAVGGAIGAAAGGIVEKITDTLSAPFDKLKELGGLQKKANILGISASELQGLTALMSRFGVEGDQVNNVLTLMGKNVADAAGGHGKAAPAFKQLGIDGKALLALPIDEQFKAIATRLAEMGPGAAQASAALHIFGGQGTNLLGALQKGGKGIDEFISKERAFGSVLSDSQIKAAADAGKAWKDSKLQIVSVWDGLVSRASLIAAPIVKFFGSAISQWYNLAQPVFDWIGRAIGRVAALLEKLEPVIMSIFDYWLDQIKSVVAEFTDLAGDMPTVEDAVIAFIKGAAIAGSYLYDTIMSIAGAFAFVAGFAVKAFGSVIEAFKNTIKELFELAGKLPDTLGGKWFRDQAKGVDQWGSKIKAVGEQMRKWGADAFTSWGDSAGKVTAWFDNLDFSAKASEKNVRAVADQMKALEYKPVAALLQGSKEAYSAELKYKFEGQEQNRQLEELKKQSGFLGRILTQLTRPDKAEILKAG